jgi:uncharacterized protein (TIGR02284 family)
MLESMSRRPKKEGRMNKQETIRILNRLIRTCRDSEELCRTLSDGAGSVNVVRSLRNRSEQWSRRGDELQALVLFLGGEPETGGSPAGWLSRARMVAKSAVLGHRDIPALEEWQRSQQQAVHRYKEALNGYLPERVRRTITLQAGRVDGRRGQVLSMTA